METGGRPRQATITNTHTHTKEKNSFLYLIYQRDE